jgi:hypothetical protein
MLPAILLFYGIRVSSAKQVIAITGYSALIVGWNRNLNQLGQPYLPDQLRHLYKSCLFPVLFSFYHSLSTSHFLLG